MKYCQTYFSRNFVAACLWAQDPQTYDILLFFLKISSFESLKGESLSCFISNPNFIIGKSSRSWVIAKDERQRYQIVGLQNVSWMKFILYVSNKLIGICPSQSDMPKIFQSYKSTITWEWLSEVDHLNVLWYWDVQLNMIRPMWVCSWPIKLQDSWKFNSSRTSRDMKLIFHIHRYPKKQPIHSNIYIGSARTFSDTVQSTSRALSKWWKWTIYL